MTPRDKVLPIRCRLDRLRSCGHYRREPQNYTAEGSRQEGTFDSWLDRFLDSYRVELDHFIDAIEAGTKPMVTEQDGRMALVLADAALRSYETGSPVKI